MAKSDLGVPVYILDSMVVIDLLQSEIEKDKFEKAERLRKLAIGKKLKLIVPMVAYPEILSDAPTCQLHRPIPTKIRLKIEQLLRRDELIPGEIDIDIARIAQQIRMEHSGPSVVDSIIVAMHIKHRTTGIITRDGTGDNKKGIISLLHGTSHEGWTINAITVDDIRVQQEF